MYRLAAEQERPLANRQPEKSEPLGSFVVLEQTGGRYHIEIKPGIPASAVMRIANLIWLHSKSAPEARLNMHVAGKERFLGLIRKLGKKKIAEFIRRVGVDGGTFVVITEARGGALGSVFWKHPALAKVLAR